jgi:ferredoxin-NADP reductase
MKHIVKILRIEQETHDVKRFIVEKPEGYKFIPGQATDVSINKLKWKNEERSFTFTSLNEQPYLEFIIKKYEEHNGVTNELHKLIIGDELIIREVFGTINYKGNGVFIAGGAGITPFIAILRQLNKENKLKGNKLIFSNKTSKDIILEKEFKEMFKDNPEDLILTLTVEINEDYENKMIDEEFLKLKIKDFKQNFYICGPDKMMKDLKNILNKLGAKTDLVVFEK